METIRDMRIRLKSIGSTKQITQSMRLISTSKVQKIKKRMEANRPYYEKYVKMVDSMINDLQFKFIEHTYIVGNSKYSKENKDNSDRSLIIVIAGDRGLCGSYNINAEKEAHTLMRKLGGAQLITIGAKGREYFRRRQKKVVQSFKGLSESPFYEDAQNIGAAAIKMYDDKIVDEVYLVYTEYNSMLSQSPKSVRLLPLDKLYIKNTENTENIEEKPEDDIEQTAEQRNETGLSNMNYDTDIELFFTNAVSAYIYSVIFSSMLESAVCEQCARIMGMDSASKNSDKMIDSLTLQYNQMRQSLITQEIAEIVGGANTSKS